MKKTVFLFFLCVCIFNSDVIAMDETELAVQRQAFDDFKNYKQEYDKQALIAYFKRDDIDINELDRGDTCLHVACYRKDEEIVQIILARADVERNVVTNDCLKVGNTALILACERQCLSIVTLLLQYGVDVNLENNEGKTALSAAISSRGDVSAMEKIISLLLARNDLDMNEESCNADAICEAAVNGYDTILNLFCDCKRVNKNHKDHFNRNFFYCFVQKGNNPSRLHFFNEFDTDQKKEFLGKQLCEAVFTSSLGFGFCSGDRIDAFIEMCQQSGADLNMRNPQGKRPVDVAEDEYNALKGRVSFDVLTWKKKVLHAFLRHTPYISDVELLYVLTSTGIDNDVIRIILNYYYRVTIERDIAFAMPIDPKQAWSKYSKQSMNKLRTTLLSDKLRLFPK